MPQTVARGPPDTRNMAGKGFEPWYPRWGRCPHTNLAMGAPFQARPNMGELIWSYTHDLKGACDTGLSTPRPASTPASTRPRPTPLDTPRHRLDVSRTLSHLNTGRPRHHPRHPSTPLDTPRHNPRHLDSQGSAQYTLYFVLYFVLLSVTSVLCTCILCIVSGSVSALYLDWELIQCRYIVLYNRYIVSYM